MLVANRANESTRNQNKIENPSIGNLQPQIGKVRLCRPSASDAAAVHALIDECKPLDLNSTYAYLLLCHHHSDTCVVAKVSDKVVGFISGYLLPRDPQVFFVWQVAVHPRARGLQLGARMLRHLIKRESAAATRFMETTVSPSNEASRRMFQRFADEAGARVEEEMLFDRDVFGAEEHEEEALLKIGPFDMAALREEVE